MALLSVLRFFCCCSQEDLLTCDGPYCFVRRQLSTSTAVCRTISLTVFVDNLSYGSQLLQQVANPFYGQITSGALSYPTVAFSQLLRPYPQYQQLLLVRQDSGDMEYQSVQFRVDKRFGHGLTFDAGYTISKTMTDAFESGVTETGPQNALYNNHYNHSLDTNDVPQRLVISWIYELPFGKEKRG